MQMLQVLISLVILGLSSALSSRILVTGAGGRTGQLVLEQLLEDERYLPLALVRSEKSAKQLRKNLQLDLNQVIVCDVTTIDSPPSGLDGCEAMVICTSAVPRVSKLSLLQNFLSIPVNLLRRKKAVDFRSLRFVWKNGQNPEMVDYHGQIAQIELAKKLGMKQVIVVSSMGGTDPSNFLNSVGKRPDGSGGDILLWKRKAEKYLVDSGLDYTIIHPGGLVDTPPGKEDFVLDVDDKLMVNKKRSISRGDVAALCVSSLSVCKGKKVALDCITKESDSVRTADQALSEFLKEGKVYNYGV